ncbi:hypothetical protein KJ895_02940 [Patescibacteria group bacterium]|nr:hypothetical protein [Patescibacteria group bacterium]
MAKKSKRNKQNKRKRTSLPVESSFPKTKKQSTPVLPEASTPNYLKKDLVKSLFLSLLAILALLTVYWTQK